MVVLLCVIGRSLGQRRRARKVSICMRAAEQSGQTRGLGAQGRAAQGFPRSLEPEHDPDRHTERMILLRRAHADSASRDAAADAPASSKEHWHRLCGVPV